MAADDASPIENAYPIFLIAEQKWIMHRSDCSGFVRAVAAEAGVPLSGMANQIVDQLEKAPGWRRLGHDANQASRLSEEGYLVIGGTRERGHGHVAIIVPGKEHGHPKGYWGKLGGVGSKNTGINYSWTHNNLPKVEYFARFSLRLQKQ